MTTWVLLVFFASYGNNGVAIQSVNLKSRDACFALADRIEGKKEMGEVLAYCQADVDKK